MNDAPERIWVQWPYANKTYSAFTEPPEDEHDEAQTPYILDTPEALAKSPHVQALAKASVALVVERAAQACDDFAIGYAKHKGVPGALADAAREIRALAPTDGLALVAELRAEVAGAVAAENQRDAELQEQHRVRKAWADRALAAEAEETGT